MTTTLISSSLLDRGRSVSPVSRASESVHACAPIHAAVPASSTGVALASSMTTTAMNLWLGGDVQSSGFGSDYATKRITPGRLKGMT